MSEHDEQVILFQEILPLFQEKYPFLNMIHAIPNGGHRHVRVAIEMKKEGVLSGVWDIFIPIPVDEFCGMYIEMKFGSNKLTDSQKEFRKNVGDAYRWAVCYSAIEAANVIGDYFGIEELINLKVS